jgi:hypothetical protein
LGIEYGGKVHAFARCPTCPPPSCLLNGTNANLRLHARRKQIHIYHNNMHVLHFTPGRPSSADVHRHGDLRSLVSGNDAL